MRAKDADSDGQSDRFEILILLVLLRLNELLYLHDSEGLGFEQIKIQELDQTNMGAKVTGAPTQQWLKDIKAVTYHNLAIRQTDSGLEVTLVLDV